MILNRKETIEKLVKSIQNEMAVKSRISGMSEELIAAHQLINEESLIQYADKVYDQFVEAEIFEDDLEDSDDESGSVTFSIPEQESSTKED